MNKVYKVIWSEARNAYVVVSEMAKSMGSKSCSTKKLLAMLVAAGVMTCAGVAPVMAANPAPEDTQIAVGKGAEATGYDSTAIGHSANASGLDSIAAGVNSTASGKWSVAVGNKANAGAEGGIAIGSNAKAQADTQINNVDAIAIGRSAQTSGEDSIAMGMQAVASKNYSVAIGGYTKNTGIGAVAIGQQANVSGDYATAIGGYSAASKDYSTALGDYAKATGEQSTAIGAYSGASGNYSTATGMLAKAEGEIATAVGYQSNAQGAQATALGYKSNASYGQSMALGSFAATGDEFATAVGYASAANASRSTAIGDFTNASADSSVALGAGSVADRAAGVNGYGKPTTGGASYYAWTSTAGAVSVGSVANGITRQITNVAAGSEDTDAVNVAQLKVLEQKQAVVYVNDNSANSLKSTNATKVGLHSIALGNAAYAHNQSVAIGNSTKAGNINDENDWAYVSTAVGMSADATGKHAVALGGYSKSTSDGSIAIGYDSEASGWGSIAFGMYSKATGGDDVAIGLCAKSNISGGVALGYASVADRAADIDGDKVGYLAPEAVKSADYRGDDRATWRSYHGAVSVGRKVEEHNGSWVETRQITYVAAGSEDTDAVNVAQLKAVEAKAGKHTILENGKNTTVEADTTDGQLTYKVNVQGDLKDITSVQNGNSVVRLNNDSINISSGNKSFSITNTGIGMNYISSTDYSSKSVMIGENGTTISGGLDVAGSKITSVAKGEISASSTDAINGSQLNDTNNRVTNVENRVTTIEGDVTNIKNDITTIRGDITTINNTLNAHTTQINQNTQDIENLDSRVTEVEKVAGKHSSVTEGDNITVTEGNNDKGGKDYTVALKKDINLDSVTTGDTVMNNDGLKVGSNVSVTKDAVTAGSTSISNDGLKIGEKTYVSSSGLNANSQKVTNVADGEISATSKDAVNGSQLNATNEQVINNSNRISRLGDRVNKVGAGAAALAALHPMDFDPDDKWSFAAGYGNYAGENAAAVGAYYRPDEKVMFSVGGTVGNGENMVNAGISFALDRTNRVSNSRTAMAREILDLRAEVAELKAMVAKGGLGSIDEDKLKLFPDVPENHWAYEYIAKLAGNGILEGYPDGSFDGDRMMSRYEFAAMLYRAMQNGAQLDSKIINEFAPEMGRIRVDRISGKDGDRSKIERVRVNGPKTERDHYGSKLAK